jgi:DNA-binding transcriptional ArsR family regulator
LNPQTSPARASTSFPGTGGRAGSVTNPVHALQAAPSDGVKRRIPEGKPDVATQSAPGRRDATPSGDVCRLLSLLADRTRLKILRILAGGERPVVALTSELGLPQPTVSHHLAWLRMMDLVSPRRQGKHVYYALGPAAQEVDGVLTLTADDATVTITPYKGG